MRFSVARRGAFLLAFATLAGCSSPGIQVERVVHLPADAAGARFVILNTRTQDADPTHAHLADLVAAQLAARNFVRVTDPAQARFAVMVWERRSGPDDAPPAPRADEAEDPNPSRNRSGGFGGGGGGMGGGGMGGGGMGGGMGEGGNGGGRMGGGRRNPTAGSSSQDSGQPWRMTHLVQIRIYDLTRPRSQEERVFDSRAQLTSGDGRADTEALILAALQNFPGRDRESFSVPAKR